MLKYKKGRLGRSICEEEIVVAYCYLNDAMGFKAGEEFAAKDYKFCEENLACLVKTTIKGLCYKDPDECSEKLYLDLWALFGGLLSIKPQFERGRKWKLYSEDEKIKYSSDYIGPSRSWAKEKGKMSEEEIGEMLVACRTIGGHMLWPVHKNPTINTSRGGKNKLYDRIDLTLYEIKCFYEDINREKVFTYKNKDGLWVLLKEEDTDERIFFNKFESFNKFIDAFYLNSFVTEKYEVKSLARSRGSKIEIVDENEEICPEDYKAFVTNNTQAVEERTKVLIELLKTIKGETCK